MILKYLGEEGEFISEEIRNAVTFSVPCDLASASIELAKWKNAVYMNRFMDSLKAKVKDKEHLVTDNLNLKRIYRSKTFRDFDDAFTAPVFGFRDAQDYWRQSSSKPYLKNIKVPSLIINAIDDSFLSKECYPYEEAERNPFCHLEVPNRGGHVGFVSPDQNGFYWSEKRAMNFILNGE